VAAVAHRILITLSSLSSKCQSFIEPMNNSLAFLEKFTA